MDIDPESAADEMYRLLTSLIIPRPIGWVSTRSADGVDNLAPFSFYMGVIEAEPPVVMSSAEHRPDGTVNNPGSGDSGLVSVLGL